MNRVKVVVLGGSSVATPELVRAVRQLERTQPMDLVLVSRTAVKLEKVARVARSLAAGDRLLQILQTTDVDAALIGADIVIVQVRVGGLEARSFDESFPHEFGLPGEETVGPGGFANAARTIPVVLEYAKKMEMLCPEAWLLNFANPSSLIQYAIEQYTRIRSIGLCNGPVLVSEVIAEALRTPIQTLELDYVGMHHFGWVTGVWCQGQNRLPHLLKAPASVSWGVEPTLVQAIGALPGPYLNYIFHPDRLYEQKKGEKNTRAHELLELQEEILADYEQFAERDWVTDALAKRKARWYRDIVAPVLVALLERQTVQFTLNVTNGNIISWLPGAAVVEVPVLLEQNRVRPLVVGAVPPDVKVLVQANCTYEMLAVEAIVERDRVKAMRALLANPIIHTYDQAAGVLDRMWNQNPLEASASS
jgi:6-phospho-beta-glucosidase